MKRFFITLGLMAAATLGLTNCNKDAFQEAVPAGDEFTITVSGIDTKTSNDGMNTVWKKKDSVAVFHAVAGTTDYVLDGKFVTAEGDGKFTGSLASALETGKAYDWYMVYPYNNMLSTPAQNSDAYLYIGNRVKGFTQKGNDSMSHIAGTSFPLVGKSSSVPSGTAPEVSMKNVASLLDVAIENKTSETFVVSKIDFEAAEDIAGSYYVNFADIDNVILTPSVGYVGNISSLNVDEAQGVEPGKTAHFYVPVKPHTVAAGKSLKFNADLILGDKAAKIEKVIDVTATVSFSAGMVKTVNWPVNSLVMEADKTLAEVTEEGSYTVRNVTVMAASKNYAIVKDATALGFIYKSSHGLNVKDVIDIVSGNAKLYNGVFEFTDGTFNKVGKAETIDYGTPVEFTKSYQDAFSAAPRLQYAHIIGTMDAKGRTVTAADGATVYLDEAVSSLSDKTVEVLGYLSGWDTKYSNATMVRAEANEYVDPDAKLFGVEKETINVLASATTATIKVTGNVAWTAEALSDNVNIDVISGTGEGTITASFPANPGSEDIEYLVSVETTEEVAKKEFEVTIRQYGASGQSYVKVESEPASWTGTYLIVYEGADANVAFNGDLEKLDNVSNSVPVTIEDGRIAQSDLLAAAAFTIEAMEGGYSIKSQSGKYVGYTGSKNGLSESDKPILNTISYDGTSTLVKNSSSTLRYNKTSGQERFRYYKTGQEPVQLYKLTD